MKKQNLFLFFSKSGIKMNDYGGCREEGLFVEGEGRTRRRRRMKYAAFYGAGALVLVSGILVLAEQHSKRAIEPEEELQRIFLQNRPAVVQNALRIQAADSFIRIPPAQAPFLLPYAQMAQYEEQPMPVKIVPESTVATAAATMDMASSQVEYPAAAATVGTASSQVEYPTGYFSGVPVWVQQPGVSTFVAMPPAQPLVQTVVQAPSPILPYSYSQLQLPFTAATPDVVGAGAGLTGDAAAEFGAAYGAAFARTYNVLMAQGGSLASKQQALRRVYEKAKGLQVVKVIPSQPVPTVQVTTTRHDPWQMPPPPPTGTAVVEHAIMPPSEPQQQQQQQPQQGGTLNSEVKSAFRFDSRGQAEDSYTSAAAPTVSSVSYLGSEDPLGAAQGAVAQAAASLGSL
jgi:hypothetical protein